MASAARAADARMAVRFTMDFLQARPAPGTDPGLEGLCNLLQPARPCAAVDGFIPGRAACAARRPAPTGGAAARDRAPRCRRRCHPTSADTVSRKWPLESPACLGGRPKAIDYSSGKRRQFHEVRIIGAVAARPGNMETHWPYSRANGRAECRRRRRRLDARHSTAGNRIYRAGTVFDCERPHHEICPP